MSRFGADTTSGAPVEGTIAAEVSAEWGTGGPAPNGGYLLALVARALGGTLPHPHPLTITAHYLSAARPGPAVIETETLREGRTQTTAMARLVQDGKERIRVLAAYGDLAELPDDVRTTAEPPAIPPLEECYAPPKDFADIVTMMRHTDIRVDPATSGWALGKPSGVGALRAWLRLADGTEPDPFMLLYTVDALPPVAFEMSVNGWVPTVEMTVHVRALPAPGWLRVQAVSRNLAGGLIEEDIEVWDSRDRLVAQGRQLARVRLNKPVTASV
ncbi:thioesterase family protein [Actinocorallia sp. A-T 12471]|uniref:thioesterase family protein n=1 Tax=Actinocorallia sp. A-T 12471 TaxID=3089813 RepID=UPI0029CE3340|nr:thioesterase family protein [Actinocorallia sp. A-T 12471]MDX6741853.1 thioesterase family protein [Actinocorallia sp. A-T 12471]